jgi:hypothetical protein
MRPEDLVYVLQHLHFARTRDALGTVRIDRGVRDYLIAALRRNHGPACSRCDAQAADRHGGRQPLADGEARRVPRKAWCKHEPARCSSVVIFFSTTGVLQHLHFARGDA